VREHDERTAARDVHAGVPRGNAPRAYDVHWREDAVGIGETRRADRCRVHEP